MTAKLLTAAAVIAAVIVAYSMWESHVEQIGYDRAIAEVNKQTLIKIEQAKQQESVWRTKYEGAQHDLELTTKRIDELVASNRDGLATVGRLRLELADTRRRVSEAPVDTCPNAAATLEALFGECVGALEGYVRSDVELAEKADRHAADVQMMRDAWPK